MALLLRHLACIPHFAPKQHIVQAKVDAWHLSVTPALAEQVRKLGSLSIGELHAPPPVSMPEPAWRKKLSSVAHRLLSAPRVARHSSAALT